MARSDRREIRNRLTVLLVHLLKYVVQPRSVPPVGSGRLPSSGPHRDGDRRQPELAIVPRGVLEQCYAEARSRAALETRLAESAFPEHCPFELALVLGSGWLPS